MNQLFLGVLPAPTPSRLKSCVRKLKPGLRFCLYYSLDRPGGIKVSGVFPTSVAGYPGCPSLTGPHRGRNFGRWAAALTVNASASPRGCRWHTTAMRAYTTGSLDRRHGARAPLSKPRSVE